MIFRRTDVTCKLLKMTRILIILILFYACNSTQNGYQNHITNNNTKKSSSPQHNDIERLDYTTDLPITISQIRKIEKSFKSYESKGHKITFGYQKRPLTQSENNFAIVFYRKNKNYDVQIKYFYELPDSNIYGIIYEFDFYVRKPETRGKSYPKSRDSLTIIANDSISKISYDSINNTTEYFNNQFEAISNSVSAKYGKYHENNTDCISRIWNDKGITINLSYRNCKSITYKRLRLVIYNI